MDITEARSIVRTLAKGIDPVTGEVFAENSPYNHPQVIRALFEVHGACSRGGVAAKTPEERRQQNVAAGRPRNAGLPWSDDDRKLVASEFAKDSSIADLARTVERSEYAIHAELVRQGVLEAAGELPGRQR